MIDPKLLSLLACPECQSPVKEEKNQIVCTVCMRKYPIKNGIPVLIANQAEK